jgi:hypothetical protein
MEEEDTTIRERRDESALALGHAFATGVALAR